VNGYLNAGNHDTHGGAQIESIMKIVTRSAADTSRSPGPTCHRHVGPSLYVTLIVDA
jgi:hypothetical protein